MTIHTNLHSQFHFPGAVLQFQIDDLRQQYREEVQSMEHGIRHRFHERIATYPLGKRLQIMLNY